MVSSLQFEIVGKSSEKSLEKRLWRGGGRRLDILGVLSTCRVIDREMLRVALWLDEIRSESRKCSRDTIIHSILSEDGPSSASPELKSQGHW
jgi:hypothetical protein